MQANRANARRHRLTAAAIPGLLLVITAAALAGCSGSAVHQVTSSAAAAAGAPAAAPEAAAAKGAAGPATGNGSAAAAVRYVPGDQQLIYTAQLTVRAGDVVTAVTRATAIVTGAGGYVSAENTSSDPGHPNRATATVTLKIPAAAYPATLGKLTGPALGTRLNLRQQTQDVTQKVADVSSRVASDKAAITQLRALLARAGSVGDLLRVQNQINAQESALESMLARQRALDRETGYATVTLIIIGPRAPAKPKPAPPAPPGLASGLAGGWHAFRLTIDWMLAIIGTAAPFAAAIAVIGGIAWRVRRRLTPRRRQPTS